MPLPQPTDLTELLQRADALAGRRLQEVAEAQGWPAPDLRRHKGWIGLLIEAALGVPPTQEAGPDLPLLGVEIKTVPLGPKGLPVESTWVTRVALGDDSETWHTSAVWRKLACVLWVPVQAGPGPWQDRRIGQPVLWRPTPEQAARLEADWRDLMELVVLGLGDDVRGHQGECLQIRPKAADAQVRVPGWDAEGRPARVRPLGFYLRSRFVAEVLAQASPPK